MPYKLSSASTETAGPPLILQTAKGIRSRHFDRYYDDYYTTTVTTTFLLWLWRKKKKGLSTHNLVFLTTWRNENPSGGRLLAAPRHDSNSCGFSFRFYQFSFADIPIIIITKKGEKKRIILISFHVKRKWRRWKRTCRSVLNKKNVWLFVLFYKYFGLHMTFLWL